ncbi:hypothetical protein C370_07303 [Cryptococcus neoformans A1-35-8]|nr:hypothetical protein C370_07303 [Cryptococcus neoformans var. grubii A1-35-8]
MPAPPIILHATPPLAPLPASDAESLYYIALFQLAAPGQYGAETGDWGQNGGNHTYYSLPPNYPQTIAKAQLATLSFPQTQYIPQRIRSVIKSRLTFVGLWGLGGLNDGDAVEEDQRILEEKFITGPGGTVAPRAWTGWRSGQEAEKRRRKWGEQQLDTRIKAAFDPLARRLEGKNYFFGDM